MRSQEVVRRQTADIRIAPVLKRRVGFRRQLHQRPYKSRGGKARHVHGHLATRRETPGPSACSMYDSAPPVTSRHRSSAGLLLRVAKVPGRLDARQLLLHVLRCCHRILVDGRSRHYQPNTSAIRSAICRVG